MGGRTAMLAAPVAIAAVLCGCKELHVVQSQSPSYVMTLTLREPVPSHEMMSISREVVEAVRPYARQGRYKLRSRRQLWSGAPETMAFMLQVDCGRFSFSSWGGGLEEDFQIWVFAPWGTDELDEAQRSCLEAHGTELIAIFEEMGVFHVEFRPWERPAYHQHLFEDAE